MEARAGAGCRGGNGGAPGGCVRLGGELGDRHGVVVGIAEVIGTAHVSAAVGLDDKVHGGCCAIAQPGQVVGFKDVQSAQQDDSSRRRRRGADDGVVVECARDGSPLDNGVLGKIVQGEQCAPLVQFFDEFVGEFAVVEIVGIGGDALESASQLGLAEGL